MDDTSNLALPSPECVKKLKEYLISLKYSEPLSLFMNEQNVVVDSLMTVENHQRLDLLISIIWNHVFKLIGDHVKENSDKITFNSGRQHFTSAVAGLHQFFIAADFSNYVNAIFACQQPTAAQKAVIIQLSTQIFQEFLLYLLPKLDMIMKVQIFLSKWQK